jgi:hypothetical protein
MFSCIACVAILSGCSYEGKIVRKEFKPLPFYSALGVRGLYRFEVRCRDGQIRRQVVSANVYADYKPGDYFSDRPEQISSPAPPAEGPHPAVAARFMIMLALRPLQEYGPHFPSVPTAWVEPAASPSNDRVSPNVGSR